MPKRILLVIVLLAAGLGVTGYALLRMSLPMLDGEVPLGGLAAPVTVERDSRGVPTVRGRSRLDVARATGFVHAQDRFFQMDLARRRAAGELSALVGPAALQFDKKSRMHRLRHVAARVLSGLPVDQRTLLTAYVEGVNEGLAQLTVPPPEYLLLRTAPQPWLPEDTLLVIYAMYFQLSDAEAVLEGRKAMLHDCLPNPVAAFLTGNDSTWGAPVDGNRLDESSLPDSSMFDLRRLANSDFETHRSFGETLAADPDLPAGNSNGWVVASSRTGDGRALVANDMHLKLRVPNVWYWMRLAVDSADAPLDVTGVTLPGLPAVIAGSTGKVAWGFTNSFGDWSDRVLIELAPGDPERYRTPDGYRRFEIHNEVIEIRGAASVAHPIRRSVWGPVVRDHRDRPVAIRWLAHEAEATNLRLVDLERAADVREALEIAAESGIPPQNIVVADARGNIGWTIAGRIPRRQGFDPDLPASWIRRDTGWYGWLAPGQYPRIVNPPGGHIWTANHQVVTGKPLAAIGDGGYWHGARARQIRDGLRGLAHATEKDMLAIQRDDRALLLARWQRLLVSLLNPDMSSRHPRAAEFGETLAAWNGRASVDSAAYRLVHAFRARARDVLFAAITAPCRHFDPRFRFEGIRQYEGPLWALIEQRPQHLLNPRYPDWETQLRAIALETIDYFDRNFEGPFAHRTWGERNTLSMRHPLSPAVPWLGSFLDMPQTPMPGDRLMPLMQSPDFGASERFAVAPGRERDGYFHMPGGQSGHPLSPYYRSGHEAWVRGEGTPFLPGAPKHRLQLRANGALSR